jgi:hypothetical protein
MTPTNTVVQEFSDAYYIVHNTDVVEYGGDYPIIPNDMEKELRRFVTQPLFKLDTAYLWPRSEIGVPRDTLAVPEGTLTTDEAQILLPKDSETRRLVRQEQVPPP